MHVLIFPRYQSERKFDASPSDMNNLSVRLPYKIADFANVNRAQLIVKVTSLFVLWRVCSGPMTLLFAFSVCFFFYFRLSVSPLVSTSIYVVHDLSETMPLLLATLAVNRFCVIQSIVFSSINSFYKKHNLHGHCLFSLYCFASYLNL